MTASEDLLTWNSRWRIRQGVIICKACEAQQDESAKDLVFMHSPECGNGRQPHKPWHELDAISRQSSRLPIQVE